MCVSIQRRQFLTLCPDIAASEMQRAFLLQLKASARCRPPSHWRPEANFPRDSTEIAGFREDAKRNNK